MKILLKVLAENPRKNQNKSRMFEKFHEVAEALRAIACKLPSRPSVAGERLWERGEAGEHELAQ